MPAPPDLSGSNSVIAIDFTCPTTSPLAVLVAVVVVAYVMSRARQPGTSAPVAAQVTPAGACARIRVTRPLPSREYDTSPGMPDSRTDAGAHAAVLVPA